MIHLVIPSKIRFIIINTILISSVLIFFQFFFWQDTAYNVVLSIKEKFSMALQEKPTQKYSIVYKKNDDSGVRLFLSEPSSQVLLQAFIAPEKHHPALKNVRIKYELKKVSLANASIIEVVRSRFINTFVNKHEEKIELVRIP